MSVIRVGSSREYAAGWDAIFGGGAGKAAATKRGKQAAAKPGKRVAKKKAAKRATKKVAKKSSTKPAKKATAKPGKKLASKARKKAVKKPRRGRGCTLAGSVARRCWVAEGGGAGRGGSNRIDEGTPNPFPFQDGQPGDGCPAGTAHAVFHDRRVITGFADESRGAPEGFDGQGERQRPGEAGLHSPVRQGLNQQGDIAWA